MNYISHYYCLVEKSPYSVLGVFLPDILPRFSYYHNKYFLKYNISNLTPNEQEIWKGIDQHYGDDSFFHTMPLFHSSMGQINAEMQKNIYLLGIKRKFIVTHVLYELILDHLVIQHYPSVVSEIYEKLEYVNKLDVLSFIEKIIGKNSEIDLFLGAYERFIERRFLNFYSQPSNLVKSLHMVSGKIGEWEYNDNTIQGFVNIIELQKKEIDFNHTFDIIQSKPHHP